MIHKKIGQKVPKLSYNRQGHIPELDGIRGIAILLVVMYHCFPCRFTGLGWIGVDLFFVLSGFLITGILIDSKFGGRYYINFIGRRVLRIFPLYYLVLLILFFLIPTFWGAKSDSTFDFYVQNQRWFWVYLQNWLYSYSGFPRNHILVHFWSLAIEEQFYLFWPFLVFFLRPRWLLRVSILLCIVAIIFRLLPLSLFHFASTYRYMNTFSRMDALLIGGTIAQLLRNGKGILEKIAVPIGILGIVIFAMGVVISGSLNFMDLSMYYTGIDLFMGMILFLSVSNVKWIQKVLGIKPLIFLGKYSYGFYVYHYIIYITLKYKLGSLLSAHLSILSPTMLMVVLGLITVAISLFVSVVSYHWFERPFLKLKVYFRNNPKVDGPVHSDSHLSNQPI